MHAAVYIRVSTDEQAEHGFSLAAQERAARLYCELRGWSLDEHHIYIDDGYSGRTGDRPAFKRLLHDIQAGQIRAVIVHKLDRLARNVQLLLGTLQDWDKHGVIFTSISEQIDFSTPIGRVVLAVLAAVAQFYSDNLSAETKKGHAEKARQGGWVGPVPFGYERVEKTLRPSSDAPAVHLLFELYATQMHSYTSLADEMNLRGYRFFDWQSKSRRLFSREGVRAMLCNRAYIGYTASAGIEHRGTHPPIIEEELWARTAALREERNNMDGVVKVRPAVATLLGGVAYCERCQARMWQNWSGRTTSRNCYYRCSNWSRRRCDQAQTRADFLDEHILHLLMGLRITPELTQMVITSMERQLAQQPPNDVPDRKTLEGQLTRLGHIYADGIIDSAEYARQRDAIRVRLLTIAEPAARIADVVAAAEGLAKLPELLQEAPHALQRQLVKSVLSQIWIADGEVVAVSPKEVFRPLFAAHWDAVEMKSRCPMGTRHTLFTARPGPMPHILRYPALWSSYRVVYTSA